MLSLPPGTSIPLTDEEVMALVSSGQYTKARGLFRGPWVQRVLATGARIHLSTGRRTVHWDQYAPSVHPVRHSLEVAQDLAKWPLGR